MMVLMSTTSWVSTHGRLKWRPGCKNTFGTEEVLQAKGYMVDAAGILRQQECLFFGGSRMNRKREQLFVKI